MLAIQADDSGKPVVLEDHWVNGARSFVEVTPERWREIVGEELDLSEVDRPIIPISVQ